MVVDTMYETEKDLKVIYRETSEGGLVKLSISDGGLLNCQ